MNPFQDLIPQNNSTSNPFEDLVSSPVKSGSKIGDLGANVETLNQEGKTRIGDVMNRVSTGETGKLSGALQVGGSVAKSLLDLTGLGIKTISPQFVNDFTGNEVAPRIGSAIGSVQNKIENSPTVQKLASSKFGDVVANTFEQNPNLSRNLQAINDIANVATLKPGAKVLKSAVSPVVKPVINKTLTAVGEKAGNIAKGLEESNLRLTPIGKQQLVKSSKDTLDYLTSLKLKGTPEQRFEQISQIYDNFENKIQSSLKGSDKTYTKKDVQSLAKSAPEKYATQFDNPEVYNQLVKLSDQLVTYAKNFKGDIPIEKINAFKRSYFKNAYNKAGDKVLNEARLAMGQILYDDLLHHLPELKAINRPYSLAIEGRKLLGKAIGRNELGLIGNLTGIAIGSGIGGAIGGVMGAGVGGYLGPTIAKQLAGTQMRSRIGSKLQSVSERLSKKSRSSGLKSGL